MVSRPKSRRPSAAATKRSRVDLGMMPVKPKVTIDRAERNRHAETMVSLTTGLPPLLVLEPRGT